jgi:hypothetical protein
MLHLVLKQIKPVGEENKNNDISLHVIGFSLITVQISFIC